MSTSRGCLSPREFRKGKMPSWLRETELSSKEKSRLAQGSLGSSEWVSNSFDLRFEEKIDIESFVLLSFGMTAKYASIFNT